MIEGNTDQEAAEALDQLAAIKRCLTLAGMLGPDEKISDGAIGAVRNLQNAWVSNVHLQQGKDEADARAAELEKKIAHLERWKISVTHRTGRPSTCVITCDGRVFFNGVSIDALLEAR